MDGEIILVDGAIPGEVVVATVSGRRGGVTRARCVEVLEPSDQRVEPPCPYVPDCGGCDLQHVAYDHQLTLKREVVHDAMRRAGVTVPDRTPVHGMAEPWRYRWRGEFHVVRGGTDGEPGLGFNRARSWTGIAVEDCLIHHRALTDAIPRLRTVIRDGADSRLSLMHLTAGENGHELLVAPKPPQALRSDVLDAAALGTGPSEARWAVGSTSMEWRGHRYRLRPRSFIQVNREQMEVLYSVVLDGVGDVEGRRVVDAYAGIGVLSVELAARVGPGGRVVCIEDNNDAASMGVLNARLNGVETTMVYDARPVEAALPEVMAAGPVAALIVDPPRAGCASTVTGLLALQGPPRLIYVSCDPATLARDLRILCTSGPYVLDRLELVDMFPQTHHIESVAILRRQS